MDPGRGPGPVGLSVSRESPVELQPGREAPGPGVGPHVLVDQRLVDRRLLAVQLLAAEKPGEVVALPASDQSLGQLGDHVEAVVIGTGKEGCEPEPGHAGLHDGQAPHLLRVRAGIGARLQRRLTGTPHVDGHDGVLVGEGGHDLAPRHPRLGEAVQQHYGRPLPPIT